MALLDSMHVFRRKILLNKSAVLLRESLFVNGLLFNSEVWYNISEQELEDLEEVDEALLRNILKAHSKTPIEALYLELGCIPLRYIVMAFKPTNRQTFAYIELQWS